MFMGHVADDLGDEFLTRLQKVIENDRYIRHPLKAAREFLRDVKAGRGQYLGHWAVVAENVDDEGLAQGIVDALICEELADIEQVSAYLFRRTICHARWEERLEDHLELLRCYYNLVSPHRALKFGPEVRTPAMQAGLVSKRLSFREVFAAEPKRILFVVVFIAVTLVAGRVREQRRAAQQHLMTEAPKYYCFRNGEGVI